MINVHYFILFIYSKYTEKLKYSDFKLRRILLRYYREQWNISENKLFSIIKSNFYLIRKKKVWRKNKY